jgi:Amt family ammonium transporter
MNDDNVFDCDALKACFVDKDFNQADKAGFADDATWILTSSFVILTMQSGFGLLEMGSAMAGYEANIMMKNVADVLFGSLSYYLVGYGISFGSPSIPFMGLGDFLPDGATNANDSGFQFASYIFQFSFAATSTTIVSGCISMRMRFFVYCIYSFFAAIFYAFVAHWVWADDGWLRALGMHDFAGAGPVHLVGATSGLVAITILGPRHGRFDGTRPASVFEPSSPSSMLFGLFMLWWGWIGFNCGSTFGITDGRWIVATRCAINTINSSSAGGLMSIVYTLIRTKGRQVKVDHIINGILGALVACTPTCASVHTHDALIIGAVGALFAHGSNELIMRLKLDDPVGAVGVHGGAGIWGLCAVGLFADGELPGIEVDSGLFRGGGFQLLGVQCLGIVTVIGWSVFCTAPFFYLIGVAVSRDPLNPRAGLRVTVKEEMLGADAYLHGIEPGIDNTADRRGAIRWPVDCFTEETKADVEEEEEKAKDLVEGAHITSSSIEGGNMMM